MLIKSLFFLLLVSVSIELVEAQGTEPPKQTGRVARVLSGDTIEVRSNNRRLNIKLLGITAPTQQYFAESRSALSKLLSGKIVLFNSTQRIGNLTEAMVFVDDVDAGQAQLRAGNAFLSAKTDDDFYGGYKNAQQAAQDESAGLWGVPFERCDSISSDETFPSETGLVDTDDSAHPVAGVAKLELVIGSDGKVISAKAICGHPVLQTLAVNLATKLRFKVSGEYRIKGVLTYNFKTKN